MILMEGIIEKMVLRITNGNCHYENKRMMLNY